MEREIHFWKTKPVFNTELYTTGPEDYSKVYDKDIFCHLVFRERQPLETRQKASLTPANSQEHFSGDLLTFVTCSIVRNPVGAKLG